MWNRNYAYWRCVCMYESWYNHKLNLKIALLLWKNNVFDSLLKSSYIIMYLDLNQLVVLTVVSIWNGTVVNWRYLWVYKFKIYSNLIDMYVTFTVKLVLYSLCQWKWSIFIVVAISTMIGAVLAMFLTTIWLQRYSYKSVSTYKSLVAI